MSGRGSIVSRNSMRLTGGSGVFMHGDAGRSGMAVAGNRFRAVSNGPNSGFNDHTSEDAVSLACPCAAPAFDSLP